MLHVTNGDVARALIEREVDGHVLAWQDALHEGPVPGDLGAAELRRTRARFISDSGWAAYEETLAMLMTRDRAVGAAAHLVLWFEHDLYDQLQLLQILALAGGNGRAIELVQHDRFLGAMQPGEPGELFSRRALVSTEQLALAGRAWKAFTAPDPMEVQAVVDDEPSALPFLAAALRRHLQQFPGLADGLGRTERQIVEAVAAGISSRDAVFAAVAAREEAPFMGDVVFRGYLERLAPLVGRGDALALTAAGAAVLAGEADALDVLRGERWLGGARLNGRGSGWRWDDGLGRLVAVA
jgi:hypothetical protein